MERIKRDLSLYFRYLNLGIGHPSYLGTLLRATSHTRLRARDQCNSSILIGGKGGAGSTSLPTAYASGTNGVYM